MRCDIDVEGLCLCWLRHVASLVEELGEGSIGQIVRKGAAVGDWNVDFDGAVEVGFQPAAVSGSFRGSVPLTYLYSWYLLRSKFSPRTGIFTHKLPCLQMELVPSIWKRIL